MFEKQPIDSPYFLVASPQKSPTKVQQRLETQQPKTSPTKDEIDEKINAAFCNRENILQKKVEKVSSRENQFKSRRKGFDEAENLKLEQIAISNKEKEELASQTAKEIIQQKADTAKKHNLKVDETRRTVPLQVQSSAESLKQSSESKILLAAKNKESLVNKDIERVALHNTKITETKSKVEESKSFKVVSIENSSKDKMVKANENKEELVMKSKMKLQEHNELVDERRASVPYNEKRGRATLEKDIEKKLESAAIRKEELQKHIVNETKELLMKKKVAGREALESHETKRKELAESTNEAIVKAESIHNEFIEKRINHTTNTQPKTTSPKKNKEGESPESITKDSIALKLEEAAARRESYLLQRGEQAGMEFQRAKERGMEVLNSSGAKVRRETTPRKILHNDEEELKVYSGEGPLNNEDVPVSCVGGSKEEEVCESEVRVDLNEKLEEEGNTEGVSDKESEGIGAKCDIA